MCSLNDDFDGQELIPEQEKIEILDDAICQKCNEKKAQVTLRKKDVYCNECFLTSATHKFRAALGKSKIVKPSDVILVGHDGDAGSSALLHFIRAGMNASARKRLMFGVKVLYVDDKIVGEEREDVSSKILKISDQIADLGFESYGVALSEALADVPSIFPLNSLPPAAKNDGKLSEIFAAIGDETARRDFQQRLIKRLMISTGKILGCTKIFLADDSTSLAVDILSNVSIGRGAQLSHECGFVDDRPNDVMILRPMREFSRREVQLYLKVLNIPYIQGEMAGKNLNGNTIQKLTSKFVKGLEEQFSGTVSTIFRTGEKIFAGRETEPAKILNFCIFCNGCLDTGDLNCTSSIEATDFSRLVSAKGSSAELDLSKLTENSGENLGEKIGSLGGKLEGNCEEKLEENLGKKLEGNLGENCKDCKCGKKGNKLGFEEIRNFLCYSCRLIFPENFDETHLPNFVKISAVERIRMRSMEKEIQDFLL